MPAVGEGGIKGTYGLAKGIQQMYRCKTCLSLHKTKNAMMGCCPGGPSVAVQVAAEVMGKEAPPVAYDIYELHWPSRIDALKLCEIALRSMAERTENDTCRPLYRRLAKEFRDAMCEQAKG